MAAIRATEARQAHFRDTGAPPEAPLQALLGSPYGVLAAEEGAVTSGEELPSPLRSPLPARPSSPSSAAPATPLPSSSPSAPPAASQAAPSMSASSAASALQTATQDRPRGRPEKGAPRAGAGCSAG
eukprot:12512645-Alexandrium_andersonii.AAC.1